MLDVACYCTQSRRIERALTDTYDRALRKLTGSYYTPPQVVEAMVDGGALPSVA